MWTSTWSDPVRLSGGNGNNNYPCIAERSGKVYVVWQKESAPGSYQIYYAASTDHGVSWQTNYVLKSISSSYDPVPVIETTATSQNTLLATFRYTSGLWWMWSGQSNPSSPTDWPLDGLINTPSPASALEYPTLTRAVDGSYTKTALAYANSSTKHVYYQYFDPVETSWFGYQNMSSIVPGTNYTHIITAIRLPPVSTFTASRQQTLRQAPGRDLCRAARCCW